MTDDTTTDVDPDTLSSMAAEIERLTESAARLRELGEAADFPAVERNAKRVEGVVTTLADNLPRELVEE